MKYFRGITRPTVNSPELRKKREVRVIRKLNHNLVRAKKLTCTYKKLYTSLSEEEVLN